MKVKVSLLYSLALLAPLSVAQTCDRKCVADWYNTPATERVTNEGPILSAYGTEGKEGALAVARCKIDVGIAMQGKPMCKRFIKKCYQLYPLAIREKMYNHDFNYIPEQRVDVYIHVNEKKNPFKD